jgi:hypothetical protein
VWLVTQSMASAPLLSWTTIPWKGLWRALTSWSCWMCGDVCAFPIPVWSEFQPGIWNIFSSQVSSACVIDWTAVRCDDSLHTFCCQMRVDWVCLWQWWLPVSFLIPTFSPSSHIAVNLWNLGYSVSFSF